MGKDISIFIDESGDFGECCPQSPFYIFTFVVHNQSVDISELIQKFYIEIDKMNIEKHNIHIGPLIRREDIFKNVSIRKRKYLLLRVLALLNKTPIVYKSFIYNKTKLKTKELIHYINMDISLFIAQYKSWLLTFDKIIVYYDNGQIELGRCLREQWKCLDNFEYRKVIPKDYILFQLCDLICTMTLISLKKELKKSEQLFFMNPSHFKKYYYNDILKKCIDYQEKMPRIKS